MLPVVSNIWASVTGEKRRIRASEVMFHWLKTRSKTTNDAEVNKENFGGDTKKRGNSTGPLPRWAARGCCLGSYSLWYILSLWLCRFIKHKIDCKYSSVILRHERKRPGRSRTGLQRPLGSCRKVLGLEGVLSVLPALRLCWLPRGGVLLSSCWCVTVLRDQAWCRDKSVEGGGEGGSGGSGGAFSCYPSSNRARSGW